MRLATHNTRGALVSPIVTRALTATVALALAGWAAVDLSGSPYVYDGDTFYFDHQGARLWGIDAPELSTPEGKAAAAAMRRLVGGRGVVCQDTGERSYNRAVAICHSSKGRDLAAALVRAGYAVDWPKFSQGAYAAEERAARSEGAGLWASPSPAFLSLSRSR